jgi:hypothetical protein
VLRLRVTAAIPLLPYIFLHGVERNNFKVGEVQDGGNCIKKELHDSLNLLKPSGNFTYYQV